MATLSCEIPDSLDARLQAAAATRRVPMAELVRESLDKTLPTPPTDEPQPAASMHDRMKKWCGCVSSGLGDLSTHPKHVEGFGED